MKGNSELKVSKHPLVSHVYAIQGMNEVTAAKRIRENCKRIGIPFSWVEQIPKEADAGGFMLRQGKSWGYTTDIFASQNVEVHVIEVVKGGYCSIHDHPKGKINIFFYLPLYPCLRYGQSARALYSPL